MIFKSSKLNDDTASTSVDEPDSQAILADDESSRVPHSALSQSNMGSTYAIDTMQVDDELHIFCTNNYLVIRKTSTSHYVEFRNEYGNNIETEVRFAGISLQPNDFYKEGKPCIFPGGWLHLTECITFRPDKLEALPKERRSIIGAGFKKPEVLPLTELERNIKQGTIVVGADKKPYYQLPIPAQKEIVFGPITDIILM